MKTKSRRLETIAELAMPCTCGGDIGTDHSWLPIILIQKGKWKRAVASDLRRGPLLAAEKNIAENGLSKQIEMRLGPGLKPYRPGECDNFVIAGMGGPEICAIIEESLEVASSAKELVLQPNTAEYEVRRYLDGCGTAPCVLNYTRQLSSKAACRFLACAAARIYDGRTHRVSYRIDSL